MFHRSMALASLTATYTDSEGEDANEEEDSNSAANSRAASPVQSSVSLLSNRVAQLVSYHDDNAASDEEPFPADLADSPGHSEGAEAEPVSADGVQLPAEPAGRCSAELQDKIQSLFDKMVNSGLDMNRVIQQRKDFRNPSIYEKLIQFCGINELGTNYPPDIYDPLRWGKESFYEELAKVQKVEMDRREKERKAKVEVVSGTRRPGGGLDDDGKRRRSKWDQPAANALAAQTLKPAGLVQPSLTTAATGTKGTVISAFGSLPKKPRL